MGTLLPAFVPQLSSRCSCFTVNSLKVHRVGNGRKFRSRPQRVSTARIIPVSAVQVNAVSGGNDGEVSEDELEKSYSVGVTVVSGCDAELRRRVIENIVAGCTGKRVVVVTASGISSTVEQDGADRFGELSQLSNANGTEKEISSDLVASPGAQNVSLATENLEGWLSCSSYEEMAEVISKLAASREYDYIVAEGATSTSIGPQQIAMLLQEKGRAALRVDTLVSVLDGDRVLDDLHANSSDTFHGNATYSASTTPPQSSNVHTQESSEERASRTTQEMHPSLDQSSSRPMLIVNLVENANVIILNRQDEQGLETKLEPIQSMISVLNRRASIVPATDCTVPVQEVVNTNLYDSEDLLFSASWKLVLMADRAGQMNSTKSVPKALKDSTFVYRARRPFHPERLSINIRDVQTFSGVIRSTGKIWLATRMLAPLEWNQAGESATLQLGTRFWASRPESEWPKDEAAREAIMENWDNQFGDRETELVFVGMDVDKERLQGLLDGCLLQDEEMVFTNLWENFTDPFIEWVPLIEDDEDLPVEEPGFLVESLSVDKKDTAKDIAQDSSTVVAEEEHAEVLVTSDSNTGKNLDNASSTVAMEETDAEIVDSSDMPALAEMGNRESEISRSTIEGALDDDDISSEILDKATALDVLAMEYVENEDSFLTPLPVDDGRFDEEDIVLSSGDAGVADEILQQMPRIGLPVTIVTGFLGSGKTTLLNYILTARHGLRVAVLVNEFGEIDIDSQLVEKGNWSSKDEVMELANGCICCSINDSFVNAVKKILERKDDFDYLVVETTGVADPVPVLNSLMVSDIADDVRVDGVLTVVAADSFENSNYIESEVARSQISSADTILLSKTDIASEESVRKALTFIKDILPSARILRCQRGRVPIGMILDVGLRLDSRVAVENDAGIPRESPSETSDLAQDIAHDQEHDHEHGHGHNAGHGHDQADPHAHSHDHNHVHGEDCGPDCTAESNSRSHNHLEAEGFMTTSFRSDIPLVPEVFMEKFLQRLPKDVFRAKGLLSFYGYPQRIIFQLSGRRYAFEEDEWPENAAPGNQLVIIGRNLNIEELQQNLEECHVQFED